MDRSRLSGHRNPAFSLSADVQGDGLAYEAVVRDLAGHGIAVRRDAPDRVGHWRLVAFCDDEGAMRQASAVLDGYFGARLLRCEDRVLSTHEGGKLRVETAPIETPEDLVLASAAAGLRVARAIARRPSAVDDLTGRSNTIAIVTDGSAVLGLGPLGPLAALPVMEGKAALFRHLAGINAVPICLATTDVDAVVSTVEAIASGFGGINLEDISAPRCFTVETALADRLAVPVFHDDQHGTAIVVLAALWNALALVGKRLADARIVVCGAGAAGTAVTRFLLAAGARDIVVCGPGGVLLTDQRDSAAPHHAELASVTNPRGVRGSLGDAVRGADVFIGLSGPGVLSPERVRTMARIPVVFALANPVPEILPEQIPPPAVVATGRSDYPNQINNALVFPGMFRGLLDARAPRVTFEIRLATARAMAGTMAGSSASGRIRSGPSSDKGTSWLSARAVASASPIRHLTEVERDSPDSTEDPALTFHRGGLVRMASRAPLGSADELALAYTPGVGRVASLIAKQPWRARRLTGRARTVAVVGNGTDLPGSGTTGPSAALPVLEGLAAVMTRLGSIDAVPLGIDAMGDAATVEAITQVAPSFGALILATVASPRCLLLAHQLAERVDIPVVGDWVGSAVVAGAAVHNALTLGGVTPGDARVVVSGDGAIVVTLIPLLVALGVGDVTLVRGGRVVDELRNEPAHVHSVARTTNHTGIHGGLAAAIRGAAAVVDMGGMTDVDLSAMVPPRALFSLGHGPGGSALDVTAPGLVGTASPLRPNWVGASLALPGLVRGLMEDGAPSDVGDVLAPAALAVAKAAEPTSPSHLLPDPFHPGLEGLVAEAVGGHRMRTVAARR